MNKADVIIILTLDVKKCWNIRKTYCQTWPLELYLLHSQSWGKRFNWFLRHLVRYRFQNQVRERRLVPCSQKWRRLRRWREYLENVVNHHLRDPCIFILCQVQKHWITKYSILKNTHDSFRKQETQRWMN